MKESIGKCAYRIGSQGAGGRSGGHDGWGGFRETEGDKWIPPCTPSLTPSPNLPFSSPLILLTPPLLFGTLQNTTPTQWTPEQGPNFGSSTLSSGFSHRPAASTKATHL